MHGARTRHGRFLSTLALLGVLTALGGCTSALATAVYLVKGNNIDAEYEGLKHKKVAVVCRPLVALQYRDTHAAKDLGAQVALLLRERIPKARIIESRKVDQWTDENMWDDFAEVGNAVGADVVVGIDLQSFSLYQGQTLYQGKADLQITVVDCKNDGQVVYEKILPQLLYPPNSGVPTSERPERQFRREFILVLADYVGRHFYAHDAYADYARDVQALR
jgi:hypothetical protein